MTVLLFVSGHFTKLLIKTCNVILKSGKAAYAMEDDGIMYFNHIWKAVLSIVNSLQVHVPYAGS